MIIIFIVTDKKRTYHIWGYFIATVKLKSTSKTTKVSGAFIICIGEFYMHSSPFADFSNNDSKITIGFITSLCPKRSCSSWIKRSHAFLMLSNPLVVNASSQLAKI